MAVDHPMTLAGARLRVNPEEVRWNFKMKVADQAAVGGKVVQILGVTMSDITVGGRYVPDPRFGDTEPWQQAERFRQYIKEQARQYAESPSAPPVRFTYPPRGWDFEVYIKSITPYTNDVEDFSPTWQLVLFPVGEGANKVVRGVKDLYIKRMMDGIGWKQTAYNGPMTQALVDEMLGGVSAQDYVAQQTGAAFLDGAGGGGFGPQGGI